MVRAREWLRRHSNVLIILLIYFGGLGASLGWSDHNQAAQQANFRHEQAAQRRQGEAIERKLCADLSTMAAIPPPSGSAAANPSRAYEDAEHRAWAGLETGIGCKGAVK